MYRIDKLLKSEQKLFHTPDLALLWNITNKNTLYTTIKRYVDRGILIPIHKGFYATAPLEKINPLRLGIGYLHRFAYLSCETVLAQQGIIFQYADTFTLVSDKSTKFRLGQWEYLVRKLNSKYLYNDRGLMEKEGIFIATLERAVADILYFDPHYHFDALKAINWSAVKKIQKEVYQR